MRKLAAGFVELNWLLIMLNSILLSAALLLGGPSVSTLEMTVEAKVILAPVEEVDLLMTENTLKYLIEHVAVSQWNLSATAAWAKYYSGAIKITEITPEVHYSMVYGDGIVDVIVDPSSW
jgi:hypothetical protein